MASVNHTRHVNDQQLRYHSDLTGFVWEMSFLQL